MCGIAGLIGPAASDAAVLPMLVALRHRGPDSEGTFVRGSVALAVRRLRVIDLVTGDQPIQSACTGAVIVYNGELYNFKELRAELVGRGHTFRTVSDTEVVLHFYEEFGPAQFHRLNGMFAFAIFDPRSGVTLARDPLGVKPLYYAPTRDALIFASEPKAIFASGLVEPRLRPAALEQYLAFGHSSGQETIFQGVLRMTPGHFGVVVAGELREKQFWSVARNAQRWTRGAAPTADELNERLVRAVDRNMLADVPVGVFLSGGLDSSLITAIVSKKHPQVSTYSVGFGVSSDELPDARRVANQFGTRHSEIVVSAADAERELNRLPEVYDEPFADYAAIPTMIMAERARRDVTVVLTGEGGDEIFGGYRRYVAEQAYGLYRLWPRRFRRALAMGRLETNPALRRLGRTLQALSCDTPGIRYAMWTEVFASHERAALLGAPSDTATYKSYVENSEDLAGIADVEAMMGVELGTWLPETYLEKVDKATMATGLEARVPLLDLDLLGFFALAPRGVKVRGLRTKVLLRDVAARYLPTALVSKKKHGFEPPLQLWLRTVLRERVAALPESDAFDGLLQKEAVRAVIKEQLGGAARGPQVWTLLVLDVWLRQLRATSSAGFRSTVSGTPPVIKTSKRVDARVLLLPRYDRLGASSRYRTYQFEPALRRAGFRTRISPLMPNAYLRHIYARPGARAPLPIVVSSFLRRMAVAATATTYGAIIVEKEMLPRFPLPLDLALTQLGARVVLDYDDPVYLEYGATDDHLGRIGAIASRARVVHAGSRYLHEVFARVNPNTVYIPTTVDLSLYRWTRRHETRATTVVGWIGTPITTRFLAAASDGLLAAFRRTSLLFRAIGANTPPVAGLTTECVPWSEATEVSDLLSLDIGIMPLPDDAWTRGKCGLKLIQYMACGLPVVASPIGANSSIVVHGETGFLASTADEWQEFLVRLASDPSLRKRMGEAGRARVEEHYSMARWIDTYVASIARVVEGV